ncbi:hypothetical protein [Propionimicrobium sp. PCR01-08-3]|uniref:hypothetical protein n=1 Tax=Propionimicrobium sp. PCR01-08-3 TaxID=3052086 RepID=UPI00255CE253|nr:hypothetical protein [Propionimicrobium sp. PCR01-08-3]WIY83179.1 hypothetical protein QQ658_02125 [Propionimicrobium sp. PCR01-08-3]
MPTIESSISPGRLLRALDAAEDRSKTYRARVAPGQAATDRNAYQFSAADLGDPESDVAYLVIEGLKPRETLLGEAAVFTSRAMIKSSVPPIGPYPSDIRVP